MLKNIKRTFFQIFITPKRLGAAKELLSTVMPELQVLQHNLKNLNKRLVAPVIDPADKIPLIVEFFALVAPWSDRGLMDLSTAFELAGEIPEPIKTLSLHFREAGRDQRGYNRTDPGEKVTMENVSIGVEDFGLHTKSVSYWISRRKSETEVCRAGNGKPMSVCDVIWWQAGSFLDSHVEPMIKLIDDLERIARGEVSAFKAAA